MNTESTLHKRYDETLKRSAAEHWMVNVQSAMQVARTGD